MEKAPANEWAGGSVGTDWMKVLFLFLFFNEWARSTTSTTSSTTTSPISFDFLSLSFSFTLLFFFLFFTASQRTFRCLIFVLKKTHLLLFFFRNKKWRAGLWCSFELYLVLPGLLDDVLTWLNSIKLLFWLTLIRCNNCVAHLQWRQHVGLNGPLGRSRSTAQWRGSCRAGSTVVVPGLAGFGWVWLGFNGF